MYNNVISDKERELFVNELNSFAYKFEQKEFDDLPGKNDPKSCINLWLGFKESYPFMFKLETALMVLHCSSVNVERSFSNLNDFKTPKRNKLNVLSLESSLLIYQKYKLISSQEMLDRCKNLWKIEKKEEGEELEEEVKDNVDSFNPFEDLLEDMDEEYENLYQTKTLNSIKRVASVPLS